MIFLRSLELLKRMEAHVLNVTYTDNRLLYLAQRIFIYPVKYLKVGYNYGISRDVAKFTFLSFVALHVLAILLKGLDPSLKTQALFFLFLPVAFLVPLVLTLLPIPSSFVAYNVTERHVSIAIELLITLKIISSAQLETVTKNISTFDEGNGR